MLSTGQLDDNPRPAVLDLDRQVSGLAAVRRWTRDALCGVTADELEDIVLVVNELVSNAFDHGSAPRQMRVHRSMEPCFVRVEIDDGSAEVPTLGTSRLDGDRGRGMLLVNRLAKDWGVTPRSDGKTVWAEITCEPPCRIAAWPPSG
ncbi:anti-sigma regulatory factor (Ser/Thr protein kinase) [Lentzea atacamensis]|uniref:Anti-sigma regulatory factor (Ser/Thr protein kinase) n=1 Tax=Lentzea atacamensis TaxID=531938 RepID=A0A316HR98_9PSEU|nr:ATP-binding protein [Lentzea atacamensis]PWK80815.1 anti-sigma regulatory factor (Ser/Thr protein kinase) [Lentzea atacamensis]